MPAKTQLKDLLNGFDQETEVKEQPIEPETPVAGKKPLPMPKCHHRDAGNDTSPDILIQWS